jgi:hypothetical protein
LQSFAWLSERDLPCIVSADLDGISSALLQGHVLGWKTVGTYDGYKLCLYQSPDSVNWEQTVFIDIEILRPTARSIGNHMLTWDKSDAATLTAQIPQCANPNLWQGFHAGENFQRKYPFGTLPLLIASVTVANPAFDISRAWLSLVLHTDSSFTNAAMYQSNALYWLSAMGVPCTSPGLDRLCTLLSRVPAQTALGLLNDVQEWVSEAGFGAKMRACRFDPTDDGDRLRLATLTKRLIAETKADIELPFAQPPVSVTNFDTAKLPIHTKGRAIASLKQVRECRVFSMAITGRSHEGLSCTFPAPNCPVALFR